MFEAHSVSDIVDVNTSLLLTHLSSSDHSTGSAEAKPIQLHWMHCLGVSDLNIIYLQKAQALLVQVGLISFHALYQSVYTNTMDVDL